MRTRARIGVVLAMLVLVLASITGVTGSTSAQAAYRICAPSGKCVYVSQVCGPGQCGQSQTYKRYYGYCSQSWGCFYYKGANYVYNAGPNPTSTQRSKITQCAANLGFTWLTAVAGGPVGFTIGGAALAVWGCAS